MSPREPFRTIDVRQTRDLILRDDVLIVDVRDAKTYAKGHLPEARNITIATLSPVLDSAPKEMPILIYCYRGYASREYAQIFSDFRFQEVYSLDGGYEEWCRQEETAASAVPPSAEARPELVAG